MLALQCASGSGQLGDEVQSVTICRLAKDLCTGDVGAAESDDVRVCHMWCSM